MNEGPQHPKDVLYDRVRDFLYAEADLIDTGRWTEWLALFVDDGWYVLPPLDAPDPETAARERATFVVAENRADLAERIKRMKSAARRGQAPRTLHQLSNIRVVNAEAGELRARANVVIQSPVGPHVGTIHYALEDQGAEFRIREKRVCLAADSLRARAATSLIL